jgi:hypothetical protein
MDEVRFSCAPGPQFAQADPLIGASISWRAWEASFVVHRIGRFAVDGSHLLLYVPLNPK